MGIKAKNEISIVDITDGRSVSSITEEYYLSTSKTELLNGSWSIEIPEKTSDTYIWTRSKIVYYNPTETEYTTPILDNSMNNAVSKGSVTQELNSELTIDGNYILIKTGKLILDTDQLKLDAEGHLIIDTDGLIIQNGSATFSGNIVASSGIFTTGFTVQVPQYDNGAIKFFNNIYCDDTGTSLLITKDANANTISNIVIGEKTISLDCNYSKSSLFLDGIDGTCSLNAENGVYVGLNDGATGFSISSDNKEILISSDSGIFVRDGLNELMELSKMTNADITYTPNLPAKSVYAHKRYNSVTITCGASSPIQELGTANDYAVIGILPYNYAPPYNIIMYYRLSSAYFGQIQIHTDGTVMIGQTRNNAGKAINYLVNKPMRWAFTYTI